MTLTGRQSNVPVGEVLTICAPLMGSVGGSGAGEQRCAQQRGTAVNCKVHESSVQSKHRSEPCGSFSRSQNMRQPPSLRDITFSEVEIRVGEDAHKKGADGVRRAKRWLESTMRVSTSFTNVESDSAKRKLSYPWPHGGQRFSFDLGGIFRGAELASDTFSAEVKMYPNPTTNCSARFGGPGPMEVRAPPSPPRPVRCAANPRSSAAHGSCTAGAMNPPLPSGT